MITTDLYYRCLCQPPKSLLVNKLFIVSGYSSATFVRRHLNFLYGFNPKIEVNLIIGMPTLKSDHIAFLQLHHDFPTFNGYYYESSPPVHSKMYSWYQDDNSVIGFAGSANYSQSGFFETIQLNQLAEEHPNYIKDYYDILLKSSIHITKYVAPIIVGHSIPIIGKDVPAGTIYWEIPDVRVRISFLDKHGNLPAISGLNWGQRLNREPNQAYLSLKLDSRKEGFLPPTAITFTLVTDDGYSFDCVVAQEGRKAIHSTINNSYLGAYFRKRLGLKPGQFVTIQDLQKYGRTDYTIEKIDEENFLLDFSVK